MSQVHKVINLKEPFRFFGMTLVQIGWLALGVLVAFSLCSRVPGDWKVNGIPAGIIFGIVIVSLSIVIGGFTELKPMIWWRNNFLYRLGLMPTLFVPRPEEGQIYPDPTIIERSDAEEFYIGRQNRPDDDDI